MSYQRRIWKAIEKLLEIYSVKREKQQSDEYRLLLKIFLIILKPIANIPNTLYLIGWFLVGVEKFFSEITDMETDCFPFATRRKIAPYLFIDLVVSQHTVFISD